MGELSLETLAELVREAAAVARGQGQAGYLLPLPGGPRPAVRAGRPWRGGRCGMGELSLETLAELVREAAALARAQGQPAYLLALPDDLRPVVVLWPEITATRQPYVAVIVLPDGSIFPRWG